MKLATLGSVNLQSQVIAGYAVLQHREYATKAYGCRSKELLSAQTGYEAASQYFASG